MSGQRTDACERRRPVEREYAQLVERHRDELHSHSRRILRSPEDAEDALQEALVKAWRALPRFEGRSSLRSWLYRIVTNTSLDEIHRRPRRLVPIDLDGETPGKDWHAEAPGPANEGRYLSREDFERARPLFDVMGKVATHVGPTGAGQVVKACNQIVVALTIEAVSEALVLGSKGGVAPEKLVEALSGGLAGSAVMEAKKEKFFSHDFEPGFRIELHHKDLGIALAAGREYGVALPVTAIVDQMLEASKAKGRGDRDHSALLTLLEEAAQHKIGEGTHGA